MEKALKALTERRCDESKVGLARYTFSMILLNVCLVTFRFGIISNLIDEPASCL